MRRGVCVVALAVCLALPATASAERAFSPRFSASTQGDITIASNSLESCLASSPGCANVQNAVGGQVAANNNNSRLMTWLDVDGDPSTFDSSSATLALPPGATVRFAGLYYGGHLASGSGGLPAPNPGARNTVLFKAPGDASYRLLTASQIDEASSQYQGFVDVTNIVAVAGPGTYTSANVQLGTGLGDSMSGGWALVVAYGDPAAPNRNLSVFDGMQHVGSGSTVTIPLSGFQTPLAGPVVSSVGIVAYEGDLGATGDGAALEGPTGFTPLSNAVNPNSAPSTANVFNSTISNAGTLVTSRVPSFRNNLGYDADLFRTTDVLGNAQTSTQVRLSSTGDAYQPGVVTLATDLYAPRISATKTGDPATANLGDTLTYTVSMQNTGDDGATGTTFTDAIPAGAAFVPGSITVNGTPVTDAAGDDLGEFAGGRVVARLGTDATAEAGGTLAPGASATVSFEVTVATAGVALGATIENTADLAFRAATTGVASTVTTAPTTTRVNVPDLAIGKTHAPLLQPGAPATYRIFVQNVGDGPTAGSVTVTDTIEAGLTINGPVGGTGWMCTTLVATITCTRSDPLAAGSAYPPLAIPVLVDPGAPPGQLSNTATVAAASDGNPDNNSFTDAGAVSEPAIDLHVEKRVTSTSLSGGPYRPDVDPVTYRIEVSNNGIANAADVQLSELLDPDMIIDSITPSQGSCSGTTCNLGTITPTQAPVTIDVRVILLGDEELYPFDGRSLDNTATASAPVGTEINPDDNSATASVATLPWSDMAIEKTFSPAQPVAGGPVTYTLIARNLGPGTVDTFAGDFLPAALLNPTISIAGGTGACLYDPAGENTGGRPVAFCDIPQFAPGDERVITIHATLAPDSAGTSVENLGFVQNFTDIDPDISDNIAIAPFTPRRSVDVGIRKTVVGSSTVDVGDVATFRLLASNSDTVAAQTVVATDTLPEGLQPVDLPAGCRAAGQVITCALGTLAAGAERTIDVRARADVPAAGRTLTNRASISSDQADLVSDNNTSSADLTVSPLPPSPSARAVDLSVQVDPPSRRVREGDASTWRITAANEGPAAATGVRLAYTPRGGTALGTRAAQADRGLGTLGAGERRTIEVRLRRQRPGRLRLDASIRGAETETRTDNNSDSAVIRVRLGRTTVSLRKQSRRETVSPGTVVPFTITVRTTGRRAARDLLVCDRLPPELGIVRARGARIRRNGACWRIGRLAPGETRRVRVTARAVGDAPGLERVVNAVTLRGANVRARRASAALRLRTPPPEPCPARASQVPARAAC